MCGALNQSAGVFFGLCDTLLKGHRWPNSVFKKKKKKFVFFYATHWHGGVYFSLEYISKHCRLGFPKLNVRWQILTNRDSYSLIMEFQSLRVCVDPDINLKVVLFSLNIINHQGAVTLCSFTQYWGASFELVSHCIRMKFVVHHRKIYAMVLVPGDPSMRLCLTWHHNTAPLHCDNSFRYSDVPASRLLQHKDAFVGWGGMGGSVEDNRY